jgi:hypothetical protein
MKTAAPIQTGENVSGAGTNLRGGTTPLAFVACLRRMAEQNEEIEAQKASINLICS